MRVGAAQRRSLVPLLEGLQPHGIIAW